MSSPTPAPPSAGPVVVVKAQDVGTGALDAGYTQGMKRSAALIGVSERLCSSVMDAEPNSASDVHHHGDQDTIVYALSGKGYIAYGPELSDRHLVLPGDHALIPANVVHQELNPFAEPVRWVIVRSGSKPVTVNLKGWQEAEETSS